MSSSSVAVAHFRAIDPRVVVRPRAERPVTREVSLDDAMDRYAQGEAAAFADLYAGLAMQLRTFLLRLAGGHALADDLLQETFMRIHRARGSFEPGARVVPWAYAIARNAWLDHARSAQSRAYREHEAKGAQDGSAPLEPATGPEADSEQAVIARETAGIVEAALG